MKNLGNTIKEYRTSLKMSQTDFAYRLGITGASISAYENGSRLPSYDVFIKIADILGVSTDVLLGRKNDKQVMINVTNLTNEQRKSIQEIVDAYAFCNKVRAASFTENLCQTDQMKLRQKTAGEKKETEE